MLLGIYAFNNYKVNTPNGTTISDDNKINDEYYDLTTSKFIDGNKLADDYTIDDANRDGCLVVDGAKVSNDDLYYNFMVSYNKKASSFMRIVDRTETGFIIYDVKYNIK